MATVSSSDAVQLEDNKSIIKVPDLASENHHVVFAQYSHPLSPEKPYFRVKVVQQAKDAVVAIGISQDTDLEQEDTEDDEREVGAPIRKPDAVVYFSDDGTIASPARKNVKEYVQTYGQGDVVGLYLDYHSKTKSLVCIFKNDHLIHRRWLSLKADCLLPTVNVWWGTVALHVDWLSPSPPIMSQDNLSDWNMPDTVTVDNNLLSLRTSPEVAAVQAPYPLHTSPSQYVEMNIVSLGEESDIGPVLGLTSALLEDNHLPGTMMEAVGYSAVDGTVYFETPSNASKLGDNCKCMAGDTMGCGLIFVDRDTTNKRLSLKVIVYFTKNSKVVYHRHLDQPMGGFYPTVGLAYQGCTVQINTQCSAPPLPDVDTWRADANRISFGLGTISSEVYVHNGPKHAEGKTSGDYRFNDLLGPPVDDVVRLRHRTNTGQLLQLLKTMTTERPYFTVAITEEDPDGKIVIGVSREGQSVAEMPGDLVDSVGYTSDGNILNGIDRFKAEPYRKGDRVGCYVEHFGESVNIVQFVKNDCLVGMASVTGGNSDIYPSLGFRGEPCAVKVDWPKPTLSIPNTFSKDNLSNWMKCSGLSLQDSCVHVQKKLRKLKARCFKSPQPLTKAWSYFEVVVHSSSLSTPSQKITKAPVVGLTNDMGIKPFKRLTKDRGTRDLRYYCHNNSIGYKDVLSHDRQFQPQYLASGDRLGFGVVFDPARSLGDRTQQPVVVYCTLNGSVFYHRPMQQPPGGFYPIISLFKYGSQVQVRTNCQLPALGDVSGWMAETEQLAKEIIQAKKNAAGDHRQTAEERQARPASPVNITDNHLTKYKIHIYCDVIRYNEATHIQARLQQKGFTTILPTRETLNRSPLPQELSTSIKTCDALVCCLGPEITTSRHVGTVLDLAQDNGRPILPCILAHTTWPPDGTTHNHFHMLTLDKIEFTEDFDWGVEQIGEKTLNLRGKGYNGKVITVELGEGAKKLYTDAQAGGRTTNQESDPNALRNAMDDADRRKATSLGNTRPSTAPTDRPTSSSGQDKTSRTSSSTTRASSATESTRGSVQRSKMCVIL